MKQFRGLRCSHVLVKISCYSTRLKNEFKMLIQDSQEWLVKNVKG